MTRIRLIFLMVISLLWLPGMAAAPAQEGNHLARLHTSLAYFARDGQRPEPRKFLLTFSFTSEADGQGFLKDVTQLGVTPGALTAWPDQVWRTEVHVKLVPGAETVGALERGLQELLVKYRGTYWTMLLQKPG